MKTVEVVCLCAIYDLKEMYEPAFRAVSDWIRLVNPDEVSDRAAIRHAFAFSPGEDDFAAFPNLRLISSSGAGVDGLLRHPGLTPEMMISRVKLQEQAEMIAAFALWHITGWQRQLLTYPQQQKQRRWNPINRTPPSAFPVGILGYGQMSQTLARRLRDMNYPVMAYASSTRMDDGIEVVSGADGLVKIAQQSRAVVNLLALTDRTRGILSGDFFRHMRPDSIVINLGRGGHLVEADLLPALDRGRPARAALDVFETEPLPADHPFWSDERVLITPHVAGDAEALDMARFVAEGIARFEAGERPEGYVERERGY